MSALACSLPRRTHLFPSIEAGLAKGVKATVVDSFGIGTTIDRILEAYLVFFTKRRTYAALADTSRRPRIDIVLDILHCKVVFVVHSFKGDLGLVVARSLHDKRFQLRFRRRGGLLVFALKNMVKGL